MASQTDGPRGGPNRPTSHRRKPSRPRGRGGWRGSALSAVVAGLAITGPLMLRSPDDEVALGPDASAPATSAPAITGVPADSPPTSPGKAPAATPAPSTDPAGATAGRSTPPVSRDAARSSTAPEVPRLSPDQASYYEAEVVALTNEQRAAHGCPVLRDDSRLRAAATGHSVDMRARDYFAHDTPDGVTPWTRVEAQGYSDPSAENIALGQPDPQAVVDAWMNSAGHRANILNCSSKAIGVGVRFGPDGPWWTEDFGYS